MWARSNLNIWIKLLSFKWLKRKWHGLLFHTNMHRWLEKLMILTKELIRTITAQVDVPTKYHPHQSHRHITLQNQYSCMCIHLYTQMHTHKIMLIARNRMTATSLEKYFTIFHGTLKHGSPYTHTHAGARAHLFFAVCPQHYKNFFTRISWYSPK
jgi:hypothetical protein